MISLNKILDKEFPLQEIEEIKTLLSKYELDKILTQAIELLKKNLKNSDIQIKIFGFIQINHIAVALLIEVNETIRKLGKEEEKDKLGLENNVGRLCTNILSKVIEKQPPEQQIKIVNSLLVSLNDVCKFKGYNFKELLHFLGLESLAGENIAEKKSENVVLPSGKESKKIPGYEWKGHKEGGFEKFISVLKNLKICDEPEKFKLLFEKPKQNLAISLNNSRPNYVLQFLCCVKESTLVSCHGNKRQGFYQVLQIHVRDFDEVFLKNIKPKGAIDRVKKLKSYNENKSKFDKILKKLITKKLDF